MAATDTAMADAVTFKTLRQSKMEAAQAALNHLERLFSQMQQVFCFAKPWECARVLASLLGSGTPIQSDAGTHRTPTLYAAAAVNMVVAAMPRPIQACRRTEAGWG